MNMTTKAPRPLALYIHVPFCRAKCLYCAFPSRPAGPATQTDYVEHLCAEIEKYFETNPGWTVRTVYVGGGTPSIMAAAEIKRLMQTVASVAPEAEEITAEANPHSDDLAKIPVLVGAGVTRLSIGVQSFNDTELGLAGRLHNSADSRRFLKACRDAGLKNLSIDLIHGLPGQTLESFRLSLEEAIGFEPEHISLYGLSIETESRLGRLTDSQLAELNIPDGDAQADMYDLAREILGRAGFVQYEISNFARLGFECRHNIAYWLGDDYLGFGPGAASYVDGARFRRMLSVDDYLAAQRQGKNTVEYLENLSSGRAATEALIMGLRLAEGVNRRSIETRFGVKLTDLCGEALERYREAGLLEEIDDNIRLSDRAYFVSNAIFRDIIS